MIQHRNKTLIGEVVALNGCDYEGCHFIDCEINATVADGPYRLVGNVLDGCRQTGDGWPKPFLIVDEDGAHLVQ